MAIILNIEQPEELLADLKRKIENRQIDSWLFDGDGDFTCLSSNLENKAWFHPNIVSNDKLVFGILGRKNVLMTMLEYSLYHSHMVNTILYNFCQRVKSICVTVPFESEYDTRKIDY